jgi:hypothetical protein
MLDQRTKKGQGDSEVNRKTQPGKVGGNAKMTEEKLAAKLAKMKCFNCGEKGHPAKACPHKHKESEEPPLAGMTLQACWATARSGRLHEFYEVCIGNSSQADIIDPRLLRNMTTTTKGYQSMNSVYEMKWMGYLDGFFYCQACNDYPASILSLANIKDLYLRTGRIYHRAMDNQDVVFTHRDKLYMADFSDWIVSDQERERVSCTLGLT